MLFLSTLCLPFVYPFYLFVYHFINLLITFPFLFSVDLHLRSLYFMFQAFRTCAPLHSVFSLVPHTCSINTSRHTCIFLSQLSTTKSLSILLLLLSSELCILIVLEFAVSSPSRLDYCQSASVSPLILVFLHPHSLVHMFIPHPRQWCAFNSYIKGSGNIL